MALASICCFKSCFEGTGFTIKTVIPRPNERICLDSRHIGHDVVLIKNKVRACGSGGALCTAPLVQNKSYFEAKVQQGGVWGVGVATRQSDLSQAPGGHAPDTWVLCHDGSIRNNNGSLYQASDIPIEGDVIGVSYDHIELNFYVNGKLQEKPVTGIRGTVYPAIYVDQGAVLDFIHEDFIEAHPAGYEPIMIEKSLL